jgi:uncharacterized repeat protein (TIGR03803 family)
MSKNKYVSAKRRPLLALPLVLGLIAPLASFAQTYKVIYTFTGGADGANPFAGVTIDKAGKLYGTTSAGGSMNYGTVYKLSHSSSGWTLSTIHEFLAGADGAGSYAAITIGANGLLYGSTGTGGSGPCKLMPVQPAPGCGTIFQLKNTKSGWQESILYSFQGPGPANDGAEPIGPLAIDAAGNIYGTTAFGGSVPGCYGYCGTVFKLSRSGKGWRETILHNFGSGTDGGAPYGGVLLDGSGNLYGPTLLTGSYAGDGTSLPPGGTIFQITPTSSGWTEQVLYSFQNGADGDNPTAGLILDNSGNLYGASLNGGPNGGGVAFELSPSGGAWTFAPLFDFTRTGNSKTFYCTDCYGPVGRTLMDSSGNLYGTAYATGAYGYGSVFKLTPSPSGWTYTSLHDFTGGSDGGNPQSALVFDSKGNLYGTTPYGATGYGVVFKIVP